MWHRKSCEVNSKANWQILTLPSTISLYRALGTCLPSPFTGPWPLFLNFHHFNFFSIWDRYEIHLLTGWKSCKSVWCRVYLLFLSSNLCVLPSRSSQCHWFLINAPKHSTYLYRKYVYRLIFLLLHKPYRQLTMHSWTLYLIDLCVSELFQLLIL